MIVVDTHAVIWLTQGQDMLSTVARAVLIEGRREGKLTVADITLRDACAGSRFARARALAALARDTRAIAARPAAPSTDRPCGKACRAANRRWQQRRLPRCP